MVGSCSVSIPASIYFITIISASRCPHHHDHHYFPILKKVLLRWGLLVCPLPSLPSFHGHRETSLLAPPVLCKRAIRWGPARITQVSKWL